MKKKGLQLQTDEGTFWLDECEHVLVDVNPTSPTPCRVDNTTSILHQQSGGWTTTPRHPSLPFSTFDPSASFGIGTKLSRSAPLLTTTLVSPSRLDECEHISVDVNPTSPAPSPAPRRVHNATPELH